MKVGLIKVKFWAQVICLSHERLIWASSSTLHSSHRITLQRVDQLEIQHNSTKTLIAIYPQNHSPVFLLLEMCERRSLSARICLSKILRVLYSNKEIWGCRRCEKLQAVSLICTLAAVFLHKYLSIQEHYIPKAESIVSFIAEELCAGGWFFFTYTSQKGIRPYSRK